MSTIHPLGDRVVIESQKKEETTSSGFIVASKDDNERPQSGKIVSVGPDVKNVQTGDEVIFKEFIPTNFKHDDQDFLILAEEDILAKIT